MSLTRLAWRNVGRNRARVVLTIAATALAALTFVLLQTVQTSWSSVAAHSSKDHLVTHHNTSFALLLPRRYVDELRELPGVRSATYVNWFGGRDPMHENDFFATFAIDGASFFPLYPEIKLPPEALAAWEEKRSAAIVGDVLAAKMGWTVGQRVHLETGFYPERPSWDFEIVGVYRTTGRSVNRSNFYLRWDYLNESADAWHKDKVGWTISQARDPERTSEVVDEIDTHFQSHGDHTFTQDESAFQASFGEGMDAMMRAMNAACLGLLVIMALLVGNTIAMAVRERTSEYGALRAIGFMPGRLALLVLGEAVLVGGLGGGLGVGLAYPVVQRGLGGWIEKNIDGILPYFSIEPRVAFTALFASMLVACAAAALPALAVSRLRVTEALRRVI
ncbi:ABC transporter permease [Sorangium sp. So ce119]|uniref:ABC transporter permease n=1 Tax=Sorangium sp. So ce119 TaxID=3133279 RepID=UPI003F6150C0